MFNNTLLNKLIFGIFRHITKSVWLLIRSNCTVRYKLYVRIVRKLRQIIVNEVLISSTVEQY